MPGVANKGEIIALEVNMRPSGGFTPDMLNYANSTNVYKIWADMIAFDRCTLSEYADKFYCIYVGRRDCNPVSYTHLDVYKRQQQESTSSRKQNFTI